MVALVWAGSASVSRILNGWLGFGWLRFGFAVSCDRVALGWACLHTIAFS